jgi:TPR repeat protein
MLLLLSVLSAALAAPLPMEPMVLSPSEIRRQCRPSTPKGCVDLARAIGARSPHEATDRALLDRLLALCERGTDDTCWIAGEFVASGRIPDQDPGGGLALMEKGCEQGDAQACASVGTWWYNRRGGSDEPSRGIPYLRRACDNIEPVGCHALALALDSGTGIVQDQAAAGRLYEENCRNGFGLSCFNLGVGRITGEGVPADAEGGLAAFRRGCTLDHARSCASLAGHLDQVIPEATRPSDSRTAEAIDAAEKACVLNDVESCHIMATRLLHGFDGPADPLEALGRFRRNCDLGYLPSCNSVAVLRLENGTEGALEALELLDRLCHQRYIEACHNAGVAAEDNRLAEPDKFRAMQYYQLACVGGSTHSCVRAATLTVQTLMATGAVTPIMLDGVQQPIPAVLEDALQGEQ